MRHRQLGITRIQRRNRPKTAMGDWAVVTMAAWLTTAMSCAPLPEPVDPAIARQLAQTPYPRNADADDLDIVVVRRGPHLVLSNRSAHAYGHGQLWLNQQYVAPVDTVPIGVDSQIHLSRFINEHGESFPTGGPLTPDKTLPVVLVELYATVPPDEADAIGGGPMPKRYRLLVRQVAR